MDPLDILLDRQHGKTLVRNLIACFLNGSVSIKGKKPTDTSQGSCHRNYNGMKILLPGLPRLNSPNLPLSIPQEDLSVNIHTAIREQFGRLPLLIVDKLKKLGASKIPNIDHVDKAKKWDGDGDGEEYEDNEEEEEESNEEEENSVSRAGM
ncbi:hypothetical protein BGX34_003829 [Mortierella sp. NVP85]|nr:hypothetical protein BGX34_003829 [Mortierella sp. NVP85]